jgi:hypothetical protein
MQADTCVLRSIHLSLVTPQLPHVTICRYMVVPVAPTITLAMCWVLPVGLGDHSAAAPFLQWYVAHCDNCTTR